MYRIAVGIAGGLMAAAYSLFAYYYLLKREKDAGESGMARYRLKKYVSIFIFLGGVGILFYDLLAIKGTIMQVCVNVFVLAWLAVIGLVDLEERIIPNHMILAGLIAWALSVAVDIFLAGQPWKQVLLFSILGGGICGGFLLIIAFIVKNALGMGDVKMFAVLGLFYGLADTYSILLISTVVMAVVAIVLLLLKKVNRKTKLPMAPFVMLGFLAGVIGGI